MPPGNAAATCVVWHLPGHEPPAELIAALGRRAVANIRVQSPFLALAEVCRLRRSAGDAPVVLLLVEPATLPDTPGVVRACRQYAPRTICWVYEQAAATRLRAVDPEALAEPASPPDPAPQIVVTPRRGPENPGEGRVRNTRVGQLGKIGNGTATATNVPPPQVGSTPQLRLRSAPSLEGRAKNADPGAVEATAPPPGEAQEAGQRRNGTSQILTQEELAMLLADDLPE